VIHKHQIAFFHLVNFVDAGDGAIPVANNAATNQVCNLS
jgi:hypothetical protein